MTDHYAILGVCPDADSGTVRLAYRALAQQHHPDHPGGSTQWMIVLNLAWAVLRDRASRDAYDRARLGKAGQAADEPVTGGARVAAFEQGPLARRRRAKEPQSVVLDFGRYAGWSLSDVAHRDPDYLAWLVAAPVGRSLAAEIKLLLRQAGGSEGLRP